MSLDIDFVQRLQSYGKDHCWQYEMRVQNLNEDLKLLPANVNYKDISIDDFIFEPILDKRGKAEASEFIKRHEWLGKLSLHTSHYFGAYYYGILAGVITMGVPNSFSKMLGDDTKHLERLISRGACISWSPKCLASKFMVWCINYMVKNTPYRVFTAYSDPTAKELGTIYQSCNFYYLGDGFGATEKYISPYSGSLISDRCFRVRSFYKQYAKELGIEWGDDWSKGDKIYWENIPDEIEAKLRQMSRDKQKESVKISFPSKHKYVYILGVDKRETRELRKRFLASNKVYPYPKVRGK